MIRRTSPTPSVGLTVLALLGCAGLFGCGDAKGDPFPGAHAGASSDPADAHRDVDRDTDGQAGAPGTSLRTLEPSMPFGAHDFELNHDAIRPRGKPQQLDRVTADFYREWKERYVVVGCDEDQATIRAEFDEENLTLSEAHGYGMVLTVLMAGEDPHAKDQFDGLVRFYQAHPSAESPALMAWYLDQDCAPSLGEYSASDGDLDIAYALLLADRQWGSCGASDYRVLAERLLQAIAEQDVSPTGKFVQVGDWVAEAPWTEVMRSSDFMPAHFHSFAQVTGDDRWTELADTLYAAFASVQAEYAADSGLLPDYLQGLPRKPAPVAEGLLGVAEDNDYFWNACRVPWRVGVDALVSGNPEAHALVQRLNRWFRQQSAGDPLAIAPGYRLDGSTLDAEASASLAFLAPLAVAAMVDSRHQEWLDALWQTLIEAPSEGYFGDTLRLLALVTLSANWWAPEQATDPCQGP